MSATAPPIDTRPKGADSDVPFDIFIIGGGINGCGVARDAAGRGLSVALAEMGDLAQATSSSSTKLFHGGLRYLEYFELRLVREALQEREILLSAMPHISWPMRFVLPYHPDMRFESQTPLSRILSTVMPWTKGRRPAWLIRLGLFIYDRLGGQSSLPGTRTVDLTRDPAGAALQDKYTLAYEYSDCWVQDARLVVLNARDAAARGATIMVRTKVVSAQRDGPLWRITVEGPQGRATYRARTLVNAAGPWVDQVLQGTLGLSDKPLVRLVRGSHIVTRRLFGHDRAYFFQGTDGRIIFAIPYEQDFTLIGTTDQDHEGQPGEAECSEAEQRYLCDFVSAYFKTPVQPRDVIWSYSGIRPLYNDGSRSASALTRDYVLKVEDVEGSAPILNIFGGKITTYRRLSESAMARLSPYFTSLASDWTAGVFLPGGDFEPGDLAQVIAELEQDYPFLGPTWAARLIRHYGTEARKILGDATCTGDLGRDFGATLTEAEVDWLIDREWARSIEDIIWRRTKLGLRLNKAQVASLSAYMRARQDEDGSEIS